MLQYNKDVVISVIVLIITSLLLIFSAVSAVHYAGYSADKVYTGSIHNLHPALKPISKQLISPADLIVTKSNLPGTSKVRVDGVFISALTEGVFVDPLIDALTTTSHEALYDHWTGQLIELPME